ncbi:ABC transporter permease [Candidatus Poribacteria bacterium]|nr:MAG: ABC transporter permease [Candidatus Poribacteria bacterium]
MKFGEGFFIGLTAIRTNKMRSLLTMIGIVVGVASVLSMIAIGDGAKLIILDSFEKIGGAHHFRLNRNPWIKKDGRWEPNRSGEYLTYEDVLAIEAECPSVSNAWCRINYYNILVLANGGAEKRTGVIGTIPLYEIGMSWGPERGRFISKADITNRTKVCVLATDVSEALFGEEDPIGEEVKVILDYEGWSGGWRPNRVAERFKVVGVMRQRGKVLGGSWNLDDRLFIPLTTMQERFTGDHHVRSFSIQANSVDHIDQAIDEVKAVLSKRHRNQDDFFKIDVPKAKFAQFEKVSRLIKIVLGGIAGFSLLVGGIGIMNMMLVSVTERSREIGLRKALGAKRRDILCQFLVEAVSMCSVGGLLGVGLGIFAGQGMANVAVKIAKVVPEWPAVISLQWMLISVAFSATIGIFFGVYPAIKAARLSPIEALRAE